MIKRKTYASLLALVAAFSLASSVFGAQAKRRNLATANAPAQQQAAPARAGVPLPASDAVVVVALRRLFTEALPRAVGQSSAKMAQVNADIEQFKARTGIDARAFDELAVGARFTNPSPNVTKIDHLVAVARGSYNTGALVAAGRLASKGKYTEQPYNGKTVYTFSLNDQVKLFGILKMHVSDLAIAALDANTLAIGEPEAVRASIDAAAGRARVDAALLNFAARGGSIFGFASDVPSSVLKDLDFGNEELTRNIAAIRRVYGGLAMTANGFQMGTVLNTRTAKDAQDLSETVEALRQFAPALIKLSGERGKLAQNAINSLKVSAQGTDVQMSLEFTQSDITALMNVL